MAFVVLALQFNPDVLVRRLQGAPVLREVYFPEFRQHLGLCAQELGIDGLLDLTLKQKDDPRALHLSSIGADVFETQIDNDEVHGVETPAASSDEAS